jgi:hypothetical protein
MLTVSATVADRTDVRKLLDDLRRTKATKATGWLSFWGRDAILEMVCQAYKVDMSLAAKQLRNHTTNAVEGSHSATNNLGNSRSMTC